MAGTGRWLPVSEPTPSVRYRESRRSRLALLTTAFDPERTVNGLPGCPTGQRSRAFRPLGLRRTLRAPSPRRLHRQIAIKECLVGAFCLLFGPAHERLERRCRGGEALPARLDEAENRGQPGSGML
jgi:hypothetical protein